MEVQKLIGGWYLVINDRTPPIPVSELARAINPERVSKSLEEILKRNGIRVQRRKESRFSKPFVVSEWWKPLLRQVRREAKKIQEQLIPF